MKNSKALGIDIGGTKSKVGIVGSAGKIFDSFTIHQKPGIKPSELFAKIAKGIKEQGWEYGSCGIAIAGTIEHPSGRLTFSPNLCWKNVDILSYASIFRSKKIIVENDANAAAWGAYCVEFQKKVKNLVCITLGTGVGAGLVLEGRIYRGASGYAGEVGHITIDPRGTKCNCGNWGCMETFIGAKYLTKRARKSLHRNITPLEIFKLAESGSMPAAGIFKKMGEYLGIGIANVVNILNPEVVLLTGGLTGNKKYFFDELIMTVRKRALWPNSFKTRIIVSRFAQELGMIGAACLALYPVNDQNKY